MKRCWQTLGWPGALLVVLLVSGAGDLRAVPPSLPQMAAADWLALVDRGQYGQSWDEAAMMLMDKADWEGLLKTRRSPLGTVVSRRMVQTMATRSLPSLPDGDYVVLTYETVFTHRQAAIETVTVMREGDGRWRVAGYLIK